MEDAFRLLQKSINLDSSNPKAHAQRMLLFQKSGNYVEALRALQEMEVVTARDDVQGQQMLAKMKSFLTEKVNTHKVGDL
jgi:hypothetical protein